MPLVTERHVLVLTFDSSYAETYRHSLHPLWNGAVTSTLWRICEQDHRHHILHRRGGENYSRGGPINP